MLVRWLLTGFQDVSRQAALATRACASGPLNIYVCPNGCCQEHTKDLWDLGVCTDPTYEDLQCQDLVRMLRVGLLKTRFRVAGGLDFAGPVRRRDQAHC